jgi:hypothetical protein
MEGLLAFPEIPPSRYGPRVGRTDLSAWAEEQAEALLSDLGNRWKHVQGVGECARRVSLILEEEERPYLVAVAYLHDVGYAPVLQHAGLHQLDGARWLRSLGHERLARIVAHHSEARFELTLRGCGAELATYEREESPATDALTYCDLTTGPTGLAMAFEDRLAEVERRYGESDVVAALRQATPHLAAAIARTEQRLCAAGMQ